MDIESTKLKEARVGVPVTRIILYDVHLVSPTSPTQSAVACPSRQPDRGLSGLQLQYISRPRHVRRELEGVSERLLPSPAREDPQHWTVNVELRLVSGLPWEQFSGGYSKTQTRGLLVAL